MDYTKIDATTEILLIVAISAVIGFILGYLWRKIYSLDRYDHVVERDFDHNHIIADEDEFKQHMAPEAPVDLPSSEDLKIIEGIGPKIEELLNNGGIENYHDLANASQDTLTEILKEGGERFKLHDPSTWPAQAELAYYGKWDELTEYQEFLSGGKELG